MSDLLQRYRPLSFNLIACSSAICAKVLLKYFQEFPRPAEPVRPLRPWSDQKSCYLRSKPCNFSVLVGPIIVRLRSFSNGRTNLGLLPPPLVPKIRLKKEIWAILGKLSPKIRCMLGWLSSNESIINTGFVNNQNTRFSKTLS